MDEYGYVRVSTSSQDPQLQIDALLRAGVPAEAIYLDRASGTRTDRPALADVLAAAKAGDRLTGWTGWAGRCRTLSAPSRTSPAGEWRSGHCRSRSTPPRHQAGSCSRCSRRSPRSSGTSSPNAPPPGWPRSKPPGHRLARPSRVHPDQVAHVHQLAARRGDVPARPPRRTRTSEGTADSYYAEWIMYGSDPRVVVYRQPGSVEMASVGGAAADAAR